MTRKPSRSTKKAPSTRSLRSRDIPTSLAHLPSKTSHKHSAPRSQPTAPPPHSPTLPPHSPTPPPRSPTPPLRSPTPLPRSLSPTQRSLSPTPFEEARITSHELEVRSIPRNRSVRRAPAAAQQDLPSAISIRINFRVGQPQTHTRVRQSLPPPDLWEYKWDEHTQDILCSRIRRRITGIPGVEWPLDSDPWLQPKHNAAFLQFLPLDEGSCDFKLKQAWHKEAKRLGRASQVVLNLFVYLSETIHTRGQGAGSGSRGFPQPMGAQTETIRRATQSRIIEARERISREVEDGYMDRLGNIRNTHFAVHLARRAPRPETERLEIPNTNTFRQMEHLDRRAEALRQETEAARTERHAEYFTVEMKMGTNVFQVEVKVKDIRTMLGLPDMDLNGLANFRQGEVSNPAEDMNDDEHEDSDYWCPSLIKLWLTN